MRKGISQRLTVDHPPFGPPVFQPPSLADSKETAKLLDSSVGNPLSAEGDTLNSSSILTFFDNLNGTQLLICCAVLVLLVMLSVWHLDNLRHWWERRSRQKLHRKSRKKARSQFISQGTLGETPSNADGQLEDCLLYTSPSPRDKRQARMPSSA